MDFLTQLFGGGFGQSASQIDPVQAIEKLNDKHGPFLLDVRQPEEYREGHIAGAKLIPLGELQRRVKELPHEREILVVCRSGNRSAQAVRYLNSAGYHAVNVKGGMLEWAHAGLPVQKGSKR